MITSFSILLVVGVLLLAPFYADAQLVPDSCRGGENARCGFCDFFKLINSILQWLLGIGTALAGLAIVWAGIQYVISQGNENKVQAAKSIILNAIIGIAIMAVSYLIIFVLLTVLTGGNFKGIFGDDFATSGGFNITCQTSAS